MMTRHSLLGSAVVLALAGTLTAFTPLPSPATTLTTVEADGLAYMREEEKLAHDLYAALNDAFGLPVFANIARSESQHGQIMQGLLNAYGLEDPAAGNAAGTFSDPALQVLYEELLARAKVSLEEALRAAALVEETDILDLKQRLAQTDEVDITTAYNNLLQASGMHLRTFAAQIERLTGEEYSPQVMIVSEYAQLQVAARPGRSGGMHGGGPRAR